MSIATVSGNSVECLPPGLRSVQAAIERAEVEEMLRRLSDHGLGIFMPHMHDERTGNFLRLPDDVTQVEAGLEVSFQSAAQIAHQTDRYLPVAWLWRTGAVTVAAACEMGASESLDDSDHPVKHKIPARC